MPKRKDNADPMFKKDIVKDMKKNKLVKSKDVFDYKKTKDKNKKKSKY
tara:strand:- start:531 stop:674 length:144 start_codon:yes stop_codon:yes gene_type:complete